MRFALRSCRPLAHMRLHSDGGIHQRLVGVRRRHKQVAGAELEGAVHAVAATTGQGGARAWRPGLAGKMLLQKDGYGGGQAWCCYRCWPPPVSQPLLVLQGPAPGMLAFGSRRLASGWPQGRHWWRPPLQGAVSRQPWVQVEPLRGPGGKPGAPTSPTTCMLESSVWLTVLHHAPAVEQAPQVGQRHALEVAAGVCPCYEHRLQPGRLLAMVV